MTKNLMLKLSLAAALVAPTFALSGDASAQTRDRGERVERSERGERGPRAERGERGPRAERGDRARGPRHGMHRRGHDPERRIARMAEELSLTPAQIERIRAVFAEARANRPDARALEPEARRAAFEAHRERVKTQMRAVLTAEQRATLEAKMAERRARWEARRGERGERGERGHRGRYRGGVDSRGI